MISRELISRVLNLNITLVDTKYSETTKRIRYVTSDNNDYYIDVYNLAHKCKVWADNNGYLLSSIINNGKAFSSVSHKTYPHKNICWSNITEHNTEPEAIFKACEWILKQESGCSE